MSDQNLENTAKIGSIKDITNWQFEIPAYQRLYDWEKLQILELLEDIQKAQEAKKGEYFIGNVVVSQEPQGNKYVLIDGQQRLTTLFLLGLCLSKTLQEKDWENFVKVGEKLRISMPLREMEEKALKQLIESNDSEDFTQKIKKCFSDLQINQKIPQALRCITEWIQNHCQNKKEFANFVYKNVKFVLVQLASNTDLNRFFVRMNNRGKQLEKHEILKARLLGKIEDQNKREYYAKIWDMCSEMDKYILQSQKDRDLSKQTDLSKRTEETATNVDGENSDKNAYTLENILKNKIEEEKKKDQVDQVDQEKFKSIVDFPTFLLHVAKLYQVETQKDKLIANETQGDKLIAIDKDKLLDIICIKGDNGGSNENSIVLDAEQVSAFINTLLLYRIVFDYFVIKKNQQKEENKDSYAILGLRQVEGKYYQVSETPRMENLAMLQNYLRVARTGEKQNYHHWLTNFLKIAKEKGDFTIEEVAKGLDFNKLLEKFQNNGNEEVLIQELEKLDTQLALEQLRAESSQLKPKLQQISDRLLLNPEDNPNENSSRVDFNKVFNEVLNQGTNTPHYWFYRLEYYLWKERSNKELCKPFDNREFSDVAEDYYFRALDSIEHIHSQSKKDEWGQENSIDIFGNLALISASFNSSLNNQDTKDKQLELKKRKNRNNVPSLKMWLIYANNTEGEVLTWGPEQAKEHQRKMIDILKNSLNQENENGGGTKQ